MTKSRHELDAPSSSTFPRLMAALDEHLKNQQDPFMVSYLGKDNLRDLRDCIREQQALIDNFINCGNGAEYAVPSWLLDDARAVLAKYPLEEKA